METAGIPSSPSPIELQLRLHEAELRHHEALSEVQQRLHEAEQRAHDAEQNAAREKKLRINYYNQHCRIKKEWEKKKKHVRIETSCLKAQVSDLKKKVEAKEKPQKSMLSLVRNCTGTFTLHSHE